MYEIGRICIKLAGRDAGGEAVIVDILEDKYVLVDGNVRRRKCNITHLEPTQKKIDIKKKASHETVKAEFEKLGLPVWETKPKKTAERPRKARGKKKKPEQKPKETKKSKKTAEKKSRKKDEKPIQEAEIIEEKPAAKKQTKDSPKKEAKPETKKPAKKAKAK